MPPKHNQTKQNKNTHQRATPIHTHTHITNTFKPKQRQHNKCKHAKQHRNNQEHAQQNNKHNTQTHTKPHTQILQNIKTNKQ